MLLCELTINGTVNYISMEGHALTNNWRPWIIGFDAPMMSIPTDHGGFCKLEFGRITFNPLLFENDWPPPAECAIALYYSDTTEAAKELIFAGVCYRNTINREEISYGLYGPDYDETVADATAYNNTLNTILNTILTGIAEIASVDTTYARAVSPNVTHTVSGDQLAIDLASDIAAFYSHIFYVVDTTAYLVDMKLDNGSRSLTEFQFFSFPQYWNKEPVAIARCGDYSRTSSYPYGQEISVDQYHDTEANVNTALDDIIAIENKARISFDVPMKAGNFPAPGEKITIPDTAHVADLSSWIRVRKLRYDFENDGINIEGEGEVAAA